MYLILATSLKIEFVLSLAFIVIYNMFNLWQCIYGLSNMVKITAKKRVKKHNLGSNLKATRFTYKYCICMNVVLSFCSICPLVAYFLKKNYSLRQNILKNMRV